MKLWIVCVVHAGAVSETCYSLSVLIDYYWPLGPNIDQAIFGDHASFKRLACNLRMFCFRSIVMTVEYICQLSCVMTRWESTVFHSFGKGTCHEWMGWLIITGRETVCTAQFHFNATMSVNRPPPKKKTLLFKHYMKPSCDL